MTSLTRQRTRRAARKDAGQVAKIIEVQERQIAALNAELAAMGAVLTAVANHYVYDHVNPATGEVLKGHQL